ncbi:DUF2141 domain-containing protein [Allomuricauda sp. d1]|uniref:DUF2141 domain-containing protein n=1 Tax=Allomuricauda sp. d1 TaxID=3136725 RepID=UPI0031DCAD5A
MKATVFSLAFLFSIFLGFSQESKGVTITVTVDNVSSDEGKVLLGLHTQDTFMKGPGIQNLESTIKDGAVTMTFENVTPGNYAIMAMHDANDNQSMDYEANGMPKESYGMSGNEMTMGPPMFQDAQFEVGTVDLEFNIRF